MLENNYHNNLNPAIRIALFIAIAILFTGCLVQEKPIEERKDIPTTTPLFSSPSPTLMVNQTNETQASPTPEPTPEGEATPTPSPTPTPVLGECTISANPRDAQGPFRAIASARFFQTNPTNVTIKCNSQDTGTQAEKHGEFYIASCSYAFVVEKKLNTVSAEADGISCATTIVVDINKDFQKGWTFTPGDEDFTLNKSISNYTTRNYTIANSGSLTLTDITCTSSRSYGVIACPSTLKPGESRPFTLAFDFTGQNASVIETVIVIKEKDLEKTFYIDSTLVN